MTDTNECWPYPAELLLLCAPHGPPCVSFQCVRVLQGTWMEQVEFSKMCRSCSREKTTR